MRTAMDRLVQEDAWFKFASKIAVIYPAHTAGGTSYANGLTRMAYLEVGGDDVDWHPDVVLHEVMHLWNYDHNVGTSNWLAAVCSLRGKNPIDLDTHAHQENPNIAFHEGFAEWASQALLHELWGLRKPRPYNRRFLYAQLGLTTLGLVEKNDDGVTRALHLLSAKGKLGWWQYLFWTAEAWPEGRPEDHGSEVGVLDLLEPHLVVERDHGLRGAPGVPVHLAVRRRGRGATLGAARVTLAGRTVRAWRPSSKREAIAASSRAWLLSSSTALADSSAFAAFCSVTFSISVTGIPSQGPRRR